MEAGMMRHRIDLQRLGEEKNEYGEPEQMWETAASIRASISPVSGRELIAAQQVHSEITHKVVIRYCSAARPSMRVRFGVRTFDILYILDPWENHSEMTLMCREVVG